MAAPCSAEELVGPLPDDYDPDDRELILEQYEESVSWQKKTCLARRNSENWETEKAIERLRVLARKMSDFKSLFHDACKVRSSDSIDLAFIEMQGEFEVYEYGETHRDGDGQLCAGNPGLGRRHARYSKILPRYGPRFVTPGAG